MEISPGQYTVTNYCRALDRGEIVVNRTYQRSDKVWPPVARSFLIESIILGFPVPKLALHQKTDLRSRTTILEIVDGQQRSTAIRSFYDDELRLSRTLETEELAGRTYSELEDEHKKAFIDYTLSVDLFLSATEADIRETFRRMNSYTVTLNFEEQRHARFQGEFKWFIHRVAGRYSEPCIQMGIFGQKQLVRMADAKLLSEVAHALLNGISTTNPKALNGLYSGRDSEFPEKRDIESRIAAGLDQMIAWQDLHNTALMKPYVVYALLLAISHVQAPASSLESIYKSPRLTAFQDDVVLPNLSSLADALANKDDAGRFADFVEASSGRTNVRAQREKRFVWLCDALLPKPI